MSSDLNNSDEGTETVQQKIDTLSASFDRRFDTVDRRFDAVDRKFDTVDTRFDALSASLDERFAAVDVALIEQRQYTEFAFDGLRDEMRNGFNAVESRFNRLERKLDQFIDTHSTTNKLVERRLTALEPRSAQE
jgi:hypothetical protein